MDSSGEEEEETKIEGWLYLIRSNRLGLHYSKKRYFVLEDNNSLCCYRTTPTPASRREDLKRSAFIDSCVRVTDNGRENIHGNVFYIFTLYNTSNPDDYLKLGAITSEEAAKWITTLMEAASKERCEIVVACSRKRCLTLRLNRTKQRSIMYSIDWTAPAPSCKNSDPVTYDVIAPSSWTIFGCKNGLRLFKEVKDGDFCSKHWDDHPAIMAVGVVDATAETIFQTVMSLGPSRSEWDFSFAQGRVVQPLDDHTDIIQKKLHSDWLPWGMRQRDLLLHRYWREDDGTYIILYHSVFHQNCPPERGYVRACLKSGGYVISPVNQGKQSLVKHMLAVDWRFWKSYMFTSSAKYITIRMLERVAALRELCRLNLENFPCFNFPSEVTREVRLPRLGIEVELKLAGEISKNEDSREGSGVSQAKSANADHSFLQTNDAADEFFDFPDESEYDQEEVLWSSEASTQSMVQDHHQSTLSTTTILVKRFHDLAAQKIDYMDLQEASIVDTITCSYGNTLQKDSSGTIACSWATADPSTFLIRGKTYLQDHYKIKADGTLMQMIAADWLKSNKREDDLGGRPGSIVQKYAAQGGTEFFFIVHIQVPGSTTYSLALYYMMDIQVRDVPLLDSFVRGDDAFRNSRFKLIPYISKGSWLVKQSVGKKACLVGQALEIHYFQGRNYLELGIDIGSSTVARGVVGLVLGYLNSLVIEMAFLIQGNIEEELPEFLLGTCRLNHLDASKAVPIRQFL
ncbi:protein ENHANCED DISEASE RESISTANCE 2-like isoform X1 [Typha latifolia]|uniref:protein ENHANCED DISEASE RESISTANCE 2-like isoform X1 n=1 Tax=Typha latifolia TaxID=4733 RepID=UPI003C2B93C7